MIEKRDFLPRVPLYYSIPMLVICIVALFILISLFRIEYPVLLLQPAPSNAINVSSCGVLSQDNTYYVLNQTLSTNVSIQVNYGACLLVNASNVVVDGNQNNIVGILGLAFNGLNITGNNITIIQFNMTDISSSILRNGLVSTGNNLVIKNNFFSNASEDTISLRTSSGSIITNNTIYDSNRGIYLYYSNNTLINQNTITGDNIPSLTSSGIALFFSNNNSLLQNTLFSKNTSIVLWSSNGNLVQNSSILNPMFSGVYIFDSNNSNLSSVKISNPLKYGVNAISFPSIPYSIFLDKINVSNGSLSGYDLDINTPYFSSNSNITVGITDSLFTSYKFNNTFANFVNSNKSNLRFNNLLNTFGNNLTDHIRLGVNYAEVKSHLNPGLNKSAKITFAGLPINATNFTLVKDGFVCPVSVCLNSSFVFNSGTATFNVTGWSNYTIDYDIDNGGSGSSGGSGTQTMIINEPDSDDQYSHGSAFPVTFDIDLSVNGSVKFSLNNGSTNVTMNTTNSLDFTYEQNQLSLGNYTFTAYANFSNGTRITNFVKFKVINTTGTTGGSSSGSSGSSGSRGSSSGTGTGSTGGNRTLQPFNSTSGTSGGTQTLNDSQSGSNVALKGMIYWLLVAVISMMIVILVILIIKAISNRKNESRLASPNIIPKSHPQGLISNLR